MAAPLEREVEKSCKLAAEMCGFIVSSFSQGYRPGGRRHGTTRQTKGIPDLYLQHRRLPIRFWAEVKRPGGKLRPEQEAWHENEHRAGGVVITVCSGAELATYCAGRVAACMAQRDGGGPKNGLDHQPATAGVPGSPAAQGGAPEAREEGA